MDELESFYFVIRVKDNSSKCTNMLTTFATSFLFFVVVVVVAMVIID